MLEDEPRHPHEICGYPDTGKVMVRPLQAVGHLEGTAYLDGEPGPPLILREDTDA